MCTAAPQASASTADATRVRSTDAGILALVREGTERSATFSTLVDTIGRSNGIVYIEFGYCAFGHLNGCLLSYIAPAHGDRYLRIIVTPDKNRRSHDQLLALIAHELRHALEVIEHVEIVDVPTLEALYRRIGTPETGGLTGYETSAARAAGDATLSELLARPVRNHVAGSTLAVGPCGQAADSPPSIAVVVYNQVGMSADTLARAKSEVTRIYGDAGVDVAWMDPAAVESGDVFAIQLLIRPRAVNVPGSIMGRAIGDTHETGGSAVLYYDRVLRSAHEREQDVARLLAYTMAHEMGHLLLPPAAHSLSGIMRRDWDGDDLRHIASGSLRFTPAQAIAIRGKVSDCCAATAAQRAGDYRYRSGDRSIQACTSDRRVWDRWLRRMPPIPATIP